MLQTHLKYALGIAAENFDPSTGQTVLHVTPMEEMHYLDGELKSNPTTDTVSAMDASGATQQTTAITDNTVEATWFPWESNRKTPPDIRRGERVILWRYSDRDKYLWSDSGMDTHLRKLETVIYVFNGTQDESDTSNTVDNSYYLEISTHKGTATFQTSQANGEYTRHSLQFNPKEGKFLLNDAHGQAVLIDSAKHLIVVTNNDDSTITVDGEDIRVESKNSIDWTATNSMSLKTKQLNIDVEAMAVTASDSVTVSTKTFSATGTSFTGSFQTATLAGITIANGHISCNGISSTAPVTAPNID